MVTTVPMLDVGFARQHFPAFTEESLSGWRFFENAGGSYACRQAITRLTRFYRETKVQPYGAFPASVKAGEAMDLSYERMAEYLNVSADEVFFGPSTSQNTYVLAQAFRAGWREGDEVIVTDQDHEANIGPWRRLAETGIVVREWRADPESGLLSLSDLDALLSDRTKLVAVTHCSNIIGAPNPIAQIAAKAHAANARLVADGVSYAPHGPPDVAALGADIYLFSLYKTYGPHHGLMVARNGVMAELANQSHGFNDTDPRKRLVPAGPDHAQIAAIAGVAEYWDALDKRHYGDNHAAAERGRRVHELMRMQERGLLRPLLDFLANRKGARVLGPTDGRLRMPTVAVDTARPPAEVAQDLAGLKFMAGAGDFYAPRILQRMGVDPARGVLRLSFVHYTSQDDIATLIAALDAVL